MAIPSRATRRSEESIRTSPRRSFTIQVANTTVAPTITIINTYSASDPANAGFEGDNFTSPDIDLNGNISAPPTVLSVTSQGNVVVNANIDVGTVTIHAGESFVQSYVPGIDSIGGDPSDSLVERFQPDRGQCRRRQSQPPAGRLRQHCEFNRRLARCRR